MRTLARTVIAVPAAVLALTAFVATSRGEPSSVIAADTVDAPVRLDGDGVDEALVTVVVVGDLPSGASVEVTVQEDDAPSSLKVEAAGETGSPVKVKDGYTTTRGLPGACESDETDTDGASDDTDAPALFACTVKVPLTFTGKADDQVTVRVSGKVVSPDTVVEPPTITVDYDPDPPVSD